MAVAPPPRRRGPNDGVLCHQCGSLFSGDGNPDCVDFNPADPKQQSYCKPGEACLYYAWEKSDTETSVIRECFSPSILIGPISNPLRAKSTCSPRDISETPGSSIMACLCDNDLCNAANGNSATSGSRLPVPNRNSPAETPRNPFDSRRPISNSIGEDDEDLTDDELSLLNQFNQLGRSTTRPPVTRPPPRRTTRPPRRTTRAPARRTTTRPPRRPATTRRPALSGPPPPTEEGGLKCFSCGSLLDPNRECDEFNPTDPDQVQTCGTNEACLLYSWEKSSNEKCE